jgi:hypothetical protein
MLQGFAAQDEIEAADFVRCEVEQIRFDVLASRRENSRGPWSSVATE